MAPERRALYAGFVLGDDRGQPVEITDDFRASGLSHLLVVSGQNVAFVLALVSPLLRRLRLGWRLVAGLALLLLFGVLTRWEPSVLRAEAMAAHRPGGGHAGSPGVGPADPRPRRHRRSSSSTRCSWARSASSCRWERPPASCSSPAPSPG